VADPYRDENESLRAENMRLRAQLGSQRVTQGKLALLLVVVDFVAIVALRPWLNGTSDIKFWSSLLVVFGVAIAAVASARGFRRNRS
jgi:hypothetical protein